VDFPNQALFLSTFETSIASEILVLLQLMHVFLLQPYNHLDRPVPHVEVSPSNSALGILMKSALPPPTTLPQSRSYRPSPTHEVIARSFLRKFWNAG